MTQHTQSSLNTPSEDNHNNLSPEYGENYDNWKGWTPEDFGYLTKESEINYLAELKNVYGKLPKNLNILEIGFGNGEFLRFADRNGWSIIGAEVNNGLIQCAREKGFNALSFEDLSQLKNDTFDLIIAFDVLEHICQDQLEQFLKEIKRLLKYNGYFIGRFPNGDSPFSLPLQNSDITHASVIGSGKIKYYATMLDVDLVYLGRSAQPLWGGSLLKTTHRFFTLPIKIFMNYFIRFLFYPRSKIDFFFFNTTTVFKKKKDSS